MKKVDPIYISNAVAWIGISAAVIYGIHKTGSLKPLFAFAFAPIVRTVTNNTSSAKGVADVVTEAVKEAANGTN